jgi:hypothetical protein
MFLHGGSVNGKALHIGKMVRSEQAAEPSGMGNRLKAAIILHGEGHSGNTHLGTSHGDVSGIR